MLGLVVHPEGGPATRFRLMAYRQAFAANRLDLTVVPSLDVAAYDLLYQPAIGLLRKASVAIGSMARQWREAVLGGPWDAIWVQREAALLGPPALEYVLSAMKGVPLVYDFDDAVWISTAGHSRHPWAARLLRTPRKAWWLMKRAAHVVAGSEDLAQVARKVAQRVTVVPTVVSRSTWTPRPSSIRVGVPVIGWIGTYGTARYLDMVLPALRRLRAEGRQFRLRIVGAGPDFVLGLEHERVPWSLEHEIEAFRELDIGLAPVADDEWGRGKCAFKQVQYFATGVACVTSPVGPAKEFAAQGAALAARNEGEWYVALARLLDDDSLRLQLVGVGRALVEQRLCTEVQGPKLVALFDEVIERPHVIEHVTRR